MFASTTMLQANFLSTDRALHVDLSMADIETPDSTGGVVAADIETANPNGSVVAARNPAGMRHGTEGRKKSLAETLTAQTPERRTSQ